MKTLLAINSPLIKKNSDDLFFNCLPGVCAVMGVN